MCAFSTLAASIITHILTNNMQLAIGRSQQMNNRRSTRLSAALDAWACISMGEDAAAATGYSDRGDAVYFCCEKLKWLYLGRYTIRHTYSVLVHYCYCSLWLLSRGSITYITFDLLRTTMCAGRSVNMRTLMNVPNQLCLSHSHITYEHTHTYR